jgi:hypothetical protein
MRRWVRYEAPIMVCVDFDNDSHNGKVVDVVLATDQEDIALARDYRGQFLVYDQSTGPRRGGGPLTDPSRRP